jgi:acyl carrier protein
MANETIQQELLRIVSSVLNKPVTVDVSRQNEPAWDSLKHVEILFSVEDSFGITFSKDELSSFNSAAAIARAIDRHASSATESKPIEGDGKTRS